MAKEDDYILIIDDSTTNQVLMEALLQEEGFAVQSASNAAEAYSMILRRRPRLILLDLLMPQVSGIECLKQFKSNKSTSDIPVIVVSAVNSAEYKEACSKLGAEDYYTKPIEIPKFIQRVASMLSNKS